MLKRLLKFLSDFRAKRRTIRCTLGLHKWEDCGSRTHKTIIYFCPRANCLKASRLLSSGKRVTWERDEVSYEQVAKLNRQERRRLGAMARRGLFGKIN